MVRRVAEQAAVGEAVLLQQILAHVQFECRPAVTEGRQSGTQRDAEGLGGRHLAGEGRVEGLAHVAPLSLHQ
ncbi:hypothetical protein [Streptomyces shaanxiensis]|uniref:Uncharacterized protein n=1 Tax=Streptomyces shaanxiensis TaxID=653357 RepID=A0ABP7W8Q9_9ACTN